MSAAAKPLPEDVEKQLAEMDRRYDFFTVDMVREIAALAMLAQARIDAKICRRFGAEYAAENIKRAAGIE